MLIRWTVTVLHTELPHCRILKPQPDHFGNFFLLRIIPHLRFKETHSSVNTAFDLLPPPPGGGISRPPKAATVHALRGRKVASSVKPLYRRNRFPSAEGKERNCFSLYLLI